MVKGHSAAAICLVACASGKVGHRAEARDLYVSALFGKSRRYAETFCDRWYILSAKHGLLGPTTKIDPYEMTLNTMPIAARREWASGVYAEMVKCTEPGDRIVVLAGKKYRETLVPLLRDRGHDVQEPLAKLGIGRQLQWLDKQV